VRGTLAPVLPFAFRKSRKVAAAAISSDSGSGSSFFFFDGKTEPALPSSVGTGFTLRGPAVSFAAEPLHAGSRRTVAPTLGLLRHHAVFESRDRTQQLAGFKWLHDVSIGLDPARFFRLEGLQLAHRQQHGNVRRCGGILQPLTDFQPAIAGHVNVQHDEIRFDFGDPLQSGRSVVDRDDVIPGIGQDLSPHVLGRHTVISEQYFPRQASSFGK